MASTTLCWERRRRSWFARHADKIRRTAQGTWDILRCDTAWPLLNTETLSAVLYDLVCYTWNGFSVKRRVAESVYYFHMFPLIPAPYILSCADMYKTVFPRLSYLTTSSFRFVRPVVLASRACLQSIAIRAVIEAHACEVLQLSQLPTFQGQVTHCSR